MAGRARSRVKLPTDNSVRAAIVVVVLALTGEAGHIVLDQLNLDLAHHFFHIVFPMLAFAIFAAFVARDVRKHGWPRFSWRI